ncbi:MAG: OmpA family protein [Elusimicrobiota bacterium]
MRRTSIIAYMSLVLAASSIGYSDASYQGKTELGFQAGGVFFEGNHGLDEDGIVGGRIGHYLTENWAVEASVVGEDTEIKNSPFKADVLIPTGEIQYHFGQSCLRPFFAIAGGAIQTNPEEMAGNALRIRGVRTDGLVGYGLGLKWMLTSWLAARVDGRHYINVDRGTAKNIGTATGGLSLLFGGHSDSAPVKKEIPAPAAVTAIPKDSDKDGVIDDNDACPGTPTGTNVDGRGCEADSDGDGIVDSKDTCPNTPAGIKVDMYGCAGDSDGDGVKDDVDQCAGTPVGIAVKADGCPADEAKVIPKNDWVLEGVNFESGSDKLKAEGKVVLDKAAGVLEANPTVTVEVQGHTDNIGGTQLNQALSDKRAMSVKNYLVGKGIAADRLTSAGYGETRPLVDNKTKEGRAKNRRIEFKVLSR